MPPAKTFLQSRGFRAGLQWWSDRARTSYLVMGHALGLGDQLSTAHLAVTLSEQFLVDVRGFHLFTTQRRDKKQNQLQKAGRCVRQGSYRAKGKATLEPSSSCHHEGKKPTLYRCKCDTQTVPTTSPVAPIRSAQVYAPRAHVKWAVPVDQGVPPSLVECNTQNCSAQAIPSL